MGEWRTEKKKKSRNEKRIQRRITDDKSEHVGKKKEEHFMKI